MEEEESFPDLERGIGKAEVCPLTRWGVGMTMKMRRVIVTVTVRSHRELIEVDVR